MRTGIENDPFEGMLTLGSLVLVAMALVLEAAILMLGIRAFAPGYLPAVSLPQALALVLVLRVYVPPRRVGQDEDAPAAAGLADVVLLRLFVLGLLWGLHFAM